MIRCQTPTFFGSSPCARAMKKRPSPSSGTIRIPSPFGRTSSFRTFRSGAFTSATLAASSSAARIGARALGETTKPGRVAVERAWGRRRRDDLEVHALLVELARLAAPRVEDDVQAVL